VSLKRLLKREVGIYHEDFCGFNRGHCLSLHKTAERPTYHGLVDPVDQSDKVENGQSYGILNSPSIRRHVAALEQNSANVPIVANELFG